MDLFDKTRPEYNRGQLKKIWPAHLDISFSGLGHRDFITVVRTFNDLRSLDMLVEALCKQERVKEVEYRSYESALGDRYSRMQGKHTSVRDKVTLGFNGRLSKIGKLDYK